MKIIGITPLNDILIITLFTFLSLLYTYPLIFNFNSNILGVYYDDPQILLWNMWWTKQSVLGGNSPFVTDKILYPFGADLSFNGTPWLKNFLSIPLQKMFGLIPAHNILVIFTFVLSGYGTFKLADYLIDDKLIAFIAGLIYAFSFYRLSQIYFLNYLSTEWIPLYIFFLLLSMTALNPTLAFCAGVFLAFSFYDHPYHAIFLIIFTGMYFLYLIVVKKTWLEGIIIIAIVSFVLCLPLLIAMLSNLKNTSVTPLEAIPALSTDILSPVTPFYNYPIKILGDLYYKIHPVPYYSLFIGFVPLFLIIFSVKYFKSNPIVIFWWLTAIVFFILSLGPYLKIGGTHNFTFLNTSFKIPLPYQLLHYSNLPGLSLVRFPYRFAVIMTLSIAILSAYGLKYLSNSTFFENNSLYSLLLISLLGMGIMFENFKIPFLFQSKEYIHPFYYQLSKEEENFSIFEIPYGIYANKSIGRRFTNFQYYQTIHNKPIFSGLVSYLPSEKIDYFENLPFFSDIIRLENGNPISNISNSEKSKILYLFNLFDIRYILIHNAYPLYYNDDGITIDAIRNIVHYIRSTVPVTEVWSMDEDDFIREYEKQVKVHNIKGTNRFDNFLKGAYGILSENQVYKIYRTDVPVKEDSILFDFEGIFSGIHLVSGWSSLEVDSEEISFRKSVKDESVLLFKIDNKDLDKLLTFKAKPVGNGEKLSSSIRIYINDKLLISELYESSNWKKFNMLLPSKLLKNGLNTVRFEYKHIDDNSAGGGKTAFAFSNMNFK